MLFLFVKKYYLWLWRKLFFIFSLFFNFPPLFRFSDNGRIFILGWWIGKSWTEKQKTALWSIAITDGFYKFISTRNCSEPITFLHIYPKIIGLGSWNSFWFSWVYKELWLVWCSDTNAPPHNLHTYLQLVPFDLLINAHKSCTINSVCLALQKCKRSMQEIAGFDI